MGKIKRKIKQVFANKGFYIILFSCAVIVAASVVIRNMSNSVIEKVNTSLGEQSARPSPNPEAVQSVSAVVDSPPAASAAPPPAAPQSAPVSETISSLQKPVNGNIIKKFSGDELVFSLTYNDWRVHKGIDIEGEIGTQVKAAAVGVVEKVYVDDVLGVTVVLGHVGGLKTLYANLQSTEFIAVGKKALAGEIIGGIGNTAVGECVEPPHLHFEAILNGKNVDPVKFFPVNM